LSSGSSNTGIDPARDSPSRAMERDHESKEDTVKSVAKLVTGAAAVAALAGCFHRGVDNVSAGDVAVDSLSATKTAILRVDNSSSATVRFNIKMPHTQPNYIAKSMPGTVRSWVLDPDMFPATEVSFEVRPENGTSYVIGPYKVNRNETIDVVLPANAGMARATVHKSTP
jgi:hypothetical protein